MSSLEEPFAGGIQQLLHTDSKESSQNNRLNELTAYLQDNFGAIMPQKQVEPLNPLRRSRNASRIDNHTETEMHIVVANQDEILAGLKGNKFMKSTRGLRLSDVKKRYNSSSKQGYSSQPTLMDGAEIKIFPKSDYDQENVSEHSCDIACVNETKVVTDNLRP